MKEHKMNEEYIKKMLQGVASAEQVSEQVETNIMQKVSQRKEYTDKLKIYRSRARIGLLVSAIVLTIYAVITTTQMLKGLEGDAGLQAVYLSVFIILGLQLLFIAMQLRPRPAK